MSDVDTLLVAAQRVIDASREVVNAYLSVVRDDELLDPYGPIQALRDRLKEYDRELGRFDVDGWRGR